MVSGVLGIIILSSFDLVELLMIHIIPWYCPEVLEITYLDCIVMWSLSRLMQCSLPLVISQR